MQIIQIYTHSPLRNFSYLVYSEETKDAFCIDPFDALQIKTNLEQLNLNLIGILNTHEHSDHTCGNKSLLAEFDVPVYGHKNAMGKIPGLNKPVGSEDIIKLNTEEKLIVMDTPGHTFSHVCLKLVDENKEVGVITGDTVFNAGVGNCHNGGDPEVLYNTIASQFMNLADEIKVFPGHDYWQNNLDFTRSVESNNEFVSEVEEKYLDLQKKEKVLISDMGLERKVNSFFRAKNKVEFLKLRELRNKW